MADAVPRQPPVVAVAASAGGVEALSSFAASLPAEFSAAVLVVLHIPATGPSVLPKILTRAGKLPARHPTDGEQLIPGVILVAPPDRHMLVSQGQVSLVVGARENGHRPAADVLMRSVAESLGPRCAGVVLSGTMDDGASGLSAVAAAGGLTLVQDPEEAAFPGMPSAAIEDAAPRFVGPVAKLADRICDWLASLPDTPLEKAMTPTEPPQAVNPGHLTALTCPECGRTSQVARYRQDIAIAEQRADVLRDLVRDLVHGVSIHEDEGNIVDSA